MHDSAKLQFDANLNTSILIYNEVMKKLVMMILQNFTEYQALLTSLEEVVKVNVEHCKPIYFILFTLLILAC